MKPLAPCAHPLPTHHITIRVPWHDNVWAGAVCTRPRANTIRLVLRRIGEGMRDEVEADCAGAGSGPRDDAPFPDIAGNRPGGDAGRSLRRQAELIGLTA